MAPNTAEEFAAAIATVRSRHAVFTPARPQTGLRWDAFPRAIFTGALAARRTVDRFGVEVLDDICGVRRFVRGVGWRGRAVCLRPAGWSTGHGGEGPCRWHEQYDNTQTKSEIGWLMAHRFAAEYDCSPWEGLLKAIRIAAGKVAYTQWVLEHAQDDLELEGRFARDDSGVGLLVHPDTGEPLGAGRLRDLSWWVTKNELWVDRLARYSKAAIDAGVAERLVEIEQLHAHEIARVLNGVLSALEGEVGMDELTMLRIRGVMRRELLAIDAEGSDRSGASVGSNSGTVEGEVVE